MGKDQACRRGSLAGSRAEKTRVCKGESTSGSGRTAGAACGCHSNAWFRLDAEGSSGSEILKQRRTAERQCSLHGYEHEPVFTAGDRPPQRWKCTDGWTARSCRGISGWRLHGKRRCGCGRRSTERCGSRCTGINGRGRTSGNRNAGRIGWYWQSVGGWGLRGAGCRSSTGECRIPCRTHSRADQTGSVSRSGRHNGGRHICGRCGSSYFSRDCAPDGKRISGKRRITGDWAARGLRPWKRGNSRRDSSCHCGTGGIWSSGYDR